MKTTCVTFRRVPRLSSALFLVSTVAAIAQTPDLPVTIRSVDSTLNAALSLGSTDILTQAQAAFVSCNFHCTVMIPPKYDGSAYEASGTIDFPLLNLSGASLVGHGVKIHYTGTGCAISSHEVQPNPSSVRIKIEGIEIVGTSAGRCGMEWYPTSDITVNNVRVTGFSNGDGISVYGTENVHIDGATSIAANKYGLRIEAVGCHQGVPDYACSPTLVAANCNFTTFTAGPGSCTYAGNMVRAKGVAFDNILWSVYEQAGPQNIEHLNDTYRDSEFNGGGGGIWLEMSRATAIRDSYFEAMSGTYIKLGNSTGAQPLFNIARNTTISGNYVTTNGAPFIDASDISHMLVEENSEILGTLSPSFVNVGQMFGKPTNPSHMKGNTVVSTNALARNGVAILDKNSAYDVTFTADQTAGNFLDIVESTDESGIHHLGNAITIAPGTSQVLGTIGIPAYGNVAGQPLCVDKAGNFVIAIPGSACRAIVPTGVATPSTTAPNQSIPFVLNGTTLYLKVSTAP